MTATSLTALGARIKALRTAKGLTQAQLAEQCGYEPLTVSRFERGAYAPGIDALESIANALDVSVRDFFSEEKKLVKSKIRHQITDIIYTIEDTKALSDILNFTKKKKTR
ncbi:helix-turn-helix domain-containing protein [Pseudomonas guariconensis]|uniref:helix-turn-helix domain-containing protein n=1 Tax=Pseudomonas guariconensis TaxID=1288410 RepID=UPI00346547A6